MKSGSPWQTLETNIVYQNKWMRIREDKVITPTGSKGIYAFLESTDSTMVVVLSNKHEIYLVHAFSYPVSSWDWELPGGNSDGEDVTLASKRELEEETGIIAKKWIRLGKTRVCNGFMSERMTTYLARDLSFNGKKFNDGQVDTGKFVPIKEVDAMIERGEIDDGQSITGIHLAQKWLAKEKSLEYA